jgi:hypothetical protein
MFIHAAWLEGAHAEAATGERPIRLETNVLEFLKAAQAEFIER